MSKNKGFSLLELIITSVIIVVVSTIAISPLMDDVPEQKVRNDIILVEQAIKRAKSIAVRTSETVTVDFSSATAAYNGQGGRILIKNSDGTVVEDYILDSNVFYNPEYSTIENNQIIFDYKGQPVDSSGTTSGFSTDSNTVIISAYQGERNTANKTLMVRPFTGTVEID